MNTFKMALLSIWRKKANSAIFLVIVVVFITTIAACASVSGSVAAQAREYAASLGASFSIALAPVQGGGYFEDREIELYGAVQTIQVYIGPKISMGIVESISATKGIQGYNVIDSTWMETQLSLYPGLFSNIYKNWEEIGYPPDDPEIAESANQKRFSTIHFTLWSELHPYFQNGAFSLIAGEHITDTDENVALVSEYVAEQNNLKVGDIITLSRNAGYEPDTFRQFDIVLGDPIMVKIIGIYTINFAQDPSVYTPEEQIADNFIFSDWATSIDVREIDLTHRGATLEEFSEIPVGKAFFFVDNPDILDRVIQDVRVMDELSGIPYALEKDTTQYEALVTSLNTIRNFTAVIIAALIIGCVIVSGLLQSLFARSRIREAGILWSFGYDKREIFSQRFLEISLLCVLALIVSAFIVQCVVELIGALSLNVLFANDTATFSIYYDEVAHESVITASSGRPEGMAFKTDPLMLIVAFFIAWAPGLVLHIATLNKAFRMPVREMIKHL